LSLTAGQWDFLYSSGMMVLATSIALEIARRKVLTPAPALNVSRERSIPFSDHL
jgi:hypothetical protein